MRQTFVIIITFGILTSCSTLKSNLNTEITGIYDAYYDFERLGFTKTLNLKKNGRFTMNRSMNSSTPPYTEVGKWILSNDTLLLYKKEVKFYKQNQWEKRKINCETENELNNCELDTLIIAKNGLYEVNDNMLFKKVTK